MHFLDQQIKPRIDILTSIRTRNQANYNKVLFQVPQIRRQVYINQNNQRDVVIFYLRNTAPIELELQSNIRTYKKSAKIRKINISIDRKVIANTNRIALPGNTIRLCYYYTIRATPIPKTKHYYIVYKKKHLNINQKLLYRYYLSPIVEKFNQISRKSTKKNIVSRLGKISILTPPPLFYPII